MMAKKNRRNKKDLLQNTDFGDLLENAIEGKDVLNNDPMEAKKLKYKKSMKGLSMQEWTKESLKYMLGAIDYDLYDNSVEWMKNKSIRRKRSRQTTNERYVWKICRNKIYNYVCCILCSNHHSLLLTSIHIKPIHYTRIATWNDFLS